MWEILRAHGVQVAEHLDDGGSEGGLLLVRHTEFMASLLNDRRDVDVVRVANTWEEMMLNLVGQTPREVVPKPGATRPIY